MSGNGRRGGGIEERANEEENKRRRTYQCLRAAGGLQEALQGRTTDLLACAERKQRGEDAPK